ncbi:MAG: hypothetical protein Tsb0014_34250 [Pleurocapsa sp.]
MTDIWQACQSTDAIIAHSALFWTYDLTQKLKVPYFLASFVPLSPISKESAAIALSKSFSSDKAFGSGKSFGSLFDYYSHTLVSLLIWQIFRKPVNHFPIPPNKYPEYPRAIASGKTLGGLSLESLFLYPHCLDYPNHPLISWLIRKIFREPVNHWLKTHLNSCLSSRSFSNSPLFRMRKDNIPFLYSYSNYVLPKPANWRKEDYVTGNWFLDSATDWTPSKELMDFLNAGSPPIYIGFGNMNSSEPETITDIALTALKKTNQRGIIATDWGSISNIDLPDPNRTFKIESVPHDWLFPKYAAVVHHGGAGTTAAVLKAGIPTITVPFFSDQPFWGQLIAELGVGTEPIEQRELTVEKLARAIDTVVSSEQIKNYAFNLAYDPDS